MTDELIVTAAGRRVRRMVGPTAWVVLECLTAAGDPDDDGAVSVATSVRALAAELGLGRDAVASAVQSLAVAGLVRVEPSRGSAGRFGSSRYIVDPSDALRPVTGTRHPRPSPTPARDQLSLLDATTAATNPPSAHRVHDAQTHATSSTRPDAASRRGSGHRGG